MAMTETTLCRSRDEIKKARRVAKRRFPRKGDSTVKVFDAIIGHLNYQTFNCFPSGKTLADEIGVSEKTVKRARLKLADAELLETEYRHLRNGNRTSSMYRIHNPERKIEAVEAARAEPKTTDDTQYRAADWFADEAPKQPENEANLSLGQTRICPLVTPDFVPWRLYTACNPDSNQEKINLSPKPQKGSGRRKRRGGRDDFRLSNDFQIFEKQVAAVADDIDAEDIAAVFRHRLRQRRSVCEEAAGRFVRCLESWPDPAGRLTDMADRGFGEPGLPPVARPLSEFRQRQNYMKAQLDAELKGRPPGTPGTFHWLEDFGADDDFISDPVAELEAREARKFARDNGLPPPPPARRERVFNTGARQSFDIEIRAEAGALDLDRTEWGRAS